jgi:GT2 family glycosyltransferase
VTAGAAREDRDVSCSVVICTYAVPRWDDLVAAVESVLDQIDADHEVIVVVDHNPALAARAQERFPSCVVVENRFGPGLSGARNTGVTVARGRVVLFLDDDAVATPGWLEAHLAAYGDATVVGTAGTVRPAWDSGSPPQWWPEPFDWVVGCNDQRVRPPGRTVRNPTGANMGFRREPILSAGGFSDRLGRTAGQPLGCEETELAIRITQQDPAARIVSVPGAVCLHRVPGDRTTWRYFRDRCVAEGRSKARVARLTGLSAATSDERDYTARTLPTAMATAVRGGHLRRALAIAAGVAFAVVGFVPAFVEERDAVDDDRHALVHQIDAERAD